MSQPSVSVDGSRFKQSRVNYFSQMPWLVLMVQIKTVKGQLFQSDAMVSVLRVPDLLGTLGSSHTQLRHFAQDSKIRLGILFRDMLDCDAHTSHDVIPSLLVYILHDN